MTGEEDAAIDELTMQLVNLINKSKHNRRVKLTAAAFFTVLCFRSAGFSEDHAASACLAAKNPKQKELKQ